ncbi:hypothetical protein [Ruminococcus flavefaciens]|uniref:Uncharacterized protein n=1 Tax=Ruminococcus flavefaciens TaxID=1265 RepID=A0A1M7MD05_RUMFL|nr:hypothetical protein [Ruminococcus flavefaciens]SHM88664.1 hypothetical protein SAMN04487860_12131 [Ruminococcus flavefaciens]
MSTNNEKGRMLCIIIGAYLIGKAVLNMIIGGGFSLTDTIIAVGLTCAMLTGIKFVNYAVAAVLVLIAVIHLPANISNIGSNWLYLIEGIIDIGCGVLLCIHSDIKEHFTNTINNN